MQIPDWLAGWLAGFAPFMLIVILCLVPLTSTTFVSEPEIVPVCRGQRKEGRQTVAHRLGYLCVYATR